MGAPAGSKASYGSLVAPQLSGTRHHPFHVSQILVQYFPLLIFLLSEPDRKIIIKKNSFNMAVFVQTIPCWQPFVWVSGGIIFGRTCCGIQLSFPPFYQRLIIIS